MVYAASDAPSPTTQGLHAWCVDLLIVMVFVAIVCQPMVTSNAVVSATPFLTDLLKLTEPSLVYTGERLRRGELPLWNPCWLAGYPHLAMPNAGVFYPTTILFGLLPFATALKIVVLLHVYLAGAFSYVLGRGVIGRRLPALYLAFAAIAGDLVFPYLFVGHVWSLQTLAWFPLAVYFANRISCGSRRGSVLGLAVVLALMIFAGDPQICAFALFFLGSYVAAHLAGQRHAKSISNIEVLLRGLAFAGGVVLGLGLAAVQLLPSRELFSESVRAHGVSYEHFSGFIGTRWDLVRGWLTDSSEVNVHAAGRLTLALAIAGGLFARNPAARAAGLAAIPCLVYAVAPRWLFDTVIQHLPVYGGVRGAARMSLMAYWVVAFLSAFGVHAWTDGNSLDGSRTNRMGLLILLSVTVFLCLPWLMGSPLPTIRIVLSLVGIGAAILALATKTGSRGWISACALLVLGSMFELGFKARTAAVFGDPGLYTINSRFQAFSDSRIDIDRIEVFADRNANRHGSAIGALTGDRLVWGYHALLLARYVRIVDEVGGMNLAPRDERGKLSSTNEAPMDWITSQMLPVIDLFNIRYLVRLDRVLIFRNLELWQAKRFREIDLGSFSVFENTEALPPIYPIHDVVVADTDTEALVLLRDGRVKYRDQVTVTAPFDASGLRAPTAPEPVTIREYSPEKIATEVDLSAPAIVVFSEMFYPGWRARVDGVEHEIVCVDTAFRGVRAEAGKHTIELTYVPASLRTGALVSGVSLLMTLALSLGAFLRSRRLRAGSEARITLD